MAFFYSNTTKGFYNTSIADYVLPEDAIEITEPEYKTLLTAVNNGKEIVVIGNQLQLQDRKTTWGAVRLKRDQLLVDSDRTQLLDYPGDKAAWATYRQTLREIPQTYSDPDVVVWPTPPA